MAKQAAKVKRGRPITTGKGTLVGVRAHDPFLNRLDAWRKDRGLSRPAAMLTLANTALGDDIAAALAEWIPDIDEWCARVGAPREYAIRRWIQDGTMDRWKPPKGLAFDPELGAFAKKKG